MHKKISAFLILAILAIACQKDPRPKDKINATAAQSINQFLKKISDKQPKVEAKRIEDINSGNVCNGVQISVSRRGSSKLSSMAAIADSLQSLLKSMDFIEDHIYAADGPTGTVRGFRTDSSYALVKIEWRPLNKKAIRQGEPLYEDRFSPRKSIYTITVSYANNMFTSTLLPISGVWRIDDFKAKQAIPLHHADTLVDQKAIIARNHVVFNEEMCITEGWKRKIVDTNAYLQQQYGITPQYAGLQSDTLHVYRCGCPIKGFSELMLLSQQRLMIHIDDVFFYLKK